MPIPKYHELTLPVLVAAKAVQEISNRGLRDQLARDFRLTSEEVSQRLPSGQRTTFEDRIYWALHHLYRAGLLEKPRPAHYCITARGKQVLAKRPAKIDNAFLSQFVEFADFLERSGVKRPVSSEDALNLDSEGTPGEVIQTAYQKIRCDLADELLAHIKQLSPQFFERLVLKLMLAMGYGGTIHDAARLTTAGADGGIDGVIKQDRLGFDNVYLQAKRWGNPVGRPEIQKFVGALHGKRAHKGVFLTTSQFSREAIDCVSTIDPKIVLLDGLELAQLMIDFNIGVSLVESIEIKRIDLDYFIED